MNSYKRLNLNKEINLFLKLSPFFLMMFLIINIISGIYIYKNKDKIFQLNQNVWVQDKQKLYTYELKVPINSDLEKLKKLHIKLSDKYEIKSIFNELKWFIDGDEDTNLIEKKTLSSKINRSNIHKIKNIKKYKKYISNDNLIIYINGNEILKVEQLNKLIGTNYKIEKYKFNNTNLTKLVSELFIIYISIIILMKILFKTFHSGLTLVYISFSVLLSSISIINLIYPNMYIDFKIIYIIIVISLIDYLYFKYRWVIFSKRHKGIEALNFSVISNLKPAFWTTIIIVASVAFLLLIDSKIIQILSITILVTTIIAFLYNILLFPIIAVYLKPKYLYQFKNMSKKIKYYFIEEKINKILTNIIVLLSTILILGFMYILIMNPKIFMKIENNNNVVVLELLNVNSKFENYKKLLNFDTFLKVKFNNDISTYSMATEIEKIKSIDNEKYNNGKQQFLNLNFQIEFNGVDKNLKRNNKYIIYIYGLNTNQRIELLNNILPNTDFKVIDFKSQIDYSKMETSYYLSLCILLSIMILSIFIAILFKNFKLFYYTFITNMIPMVLFSIVVYALNIPISFQLLVAVMIAFVLTTDSIIHLNYRYWKSRKLYEFDKEESIREMFLFSVLPIIISSTLLIFIFTILFSIHPELKEFSLYLIFSIITSTIIDIIIYPILLINSDTD